MRGKLTDATWIGPIRNERDYDRALKEIAVYFDDEPKRGTAEADRFDVLATLIEAYEVKRWPVDPSVTGRAC
jgi:HTH-type transcriptional regulator/antitoxin HigA